MSNYRFTWKSAQTWYFILVSALAVIYEVNNSNKKIVIIEIKSLKTYSAIKSMPRGKNGQ